MLLLLEILVWKFLLFIRPAQSNQAKKLWFPKYSNHASTGKVNLVPELSRYDCVTKVHGQVTKHTQVAIVTILLGESVYVLATRVIHYAQWTCHTAKIQQVPACYLCSEASMAWRVANILWKLWGLRLVAVDLKKESFFHTSCISANLLTQLPICVNSRLLLQVCIKTLTLHLQHCICMTHYTSSCYSHQVFELSCCSQRTTILEAECNWTLLSCSFHSLLAYYVSSNENSNTICN